MQSTGENSMPDTSHFLESYVHRNYKKVNGWLGKDTIQQLIRVNDIQNKLGISGHVGEIGVHHGKLFILLYLLAREEELALALDIFEQQALNVDKSGCGNLTTLKMNLDTYAGGQSKLKVINADSTTIGATELTSAVGGEFRFLSIDGGHMANIVRYDLNTASSAICDGGVIILDDYFNPEFPGVSEGVNQFFQMDNKKKLVPFFVAMNKVYITTHNYAERYMDHFVQADLGISYNKTIKFKIYDTYSLPIRVTELFGASVLSYSPDHFKVSYRIIQSIKRQRTRIRKQLSDSKTWTYLRNTKLGHFIRSVANKLAPY